MQELVHAADKRRVGPRLKAGGVEIAFVVLVAYRERLQGLPPGGKVRVRHCRDQAGIQPARKKSRHRHVGNQLPLDSVHHQVPHPAHRGREIVGVFVVHQLPVAVQQQAAFVRFIEGVLPGEQFVYVLEHPAARRPAGTQQQHFRQPPGVHPGRHRRVRQQGLDLAAEQQAVIGQRIEQRLDAAAVPRQEQCARPRRPDGKSKDAVEALHAGDPPFGIGMQQDLGVRTAGESMTAPFQQSAQFRRVVQFPVINDRVTFPLPVQLHGLAAVFQIHHRQPRMDQGGAAADVHAPLIRPTAGQRALHGAVGGVPPLNGARVAPDLPCDSTHRKSPFRCCSYQEYAERGVFRTGPRWRPRYAAPLHPCSAGAVPRSPAP